MVRRKHSICLKPGKAPQPLTLTHTNAAGIDIGNASHCVAVAPDRDDEPVREFASFTADLNALADWLQAYSAYTHCRDLRLREHHLDRRVAGAAPRCDHLIGEAA